MDSYEDDWCLSDAQLDNEVLMFLQTEFSQIEDEKRFLDFILDLRLDDVSMQAVVSDCFVAIENLVSIAEWLIHTAYLNEKSWREYALKFFSKAIDIMDNDLQISVDCDELYDDAYTERNNFLNASDANYAYAKSIIRNKLTQCFDASDASSEVASLLRNVTTPIYTKIKKVLIDGEGFEDIDDAQRYINRQIIEQLSCGEHVPSFHVEFVLGEKSQIFDDRTIDFSNMVDMFEEYSFVHMALEELDESEEYIGLDFEIDLSAYKERYHNTLNLDFLHDDMLKDAYLLLSLYSKDFRGIIQNIKPDEQSVVICELLLKTYEVEIAKFELEIHAIDCISEQERKKICADADNMQDKEKHMMYLYLKRYKLADYAFKELIDTKIDSIVASQEKYEYSTKRSIGYMDDLLKSNT